MNCAVTVRLLSLTILMDVVLLGVCEIYRSFDWSPLNPLFLANGNTSAYRINVDLYSRFHIICPNPANYPVTVENPIQKENMYENIWIVDKKSFDSCIVNTTNRKNLRLYHCDDPLKLKYHTMIFLPRISVEGQPEFELGKDHYFIATSNGSENSLKNTALGHCHTKNMRFIVYVCKDNDDPLCRTRGPGQSSSSITGNETTTQLPTTGTGDKTSGDAVAAGREAKCIIAAKQTVWLILVCALGVLVLLLLISHAFLCYSRRNIRRSRYSRNEEKLANLL